MKIPNIPHWLPTALVAAFIFSGAMLLLSGCSAGTWSAM